ncbi:hypothetical protein DFH09DRAFT_254869 [Mycena vulgaris]|nr:hypothetical protein DFH09DRAFT_254869 [Mycena vulgaris]
MLSFYSMMTSGGTRIPKRRHPDFSRLGVLEWYAEDPPPPPLMPGTAPASPIPANFTRAIAGVLHDRNEGDKPWLGLVVYSHAREDSVMPMYHNAAKVTGEVRLILDRKMSVGSVDIWVTIKSDSVLDLYKPPVAAMKVNVWNREKGNPKMPGARPLKGKFPKGTFVFPFEFPPLLEDTLVIHPSDTKRRNKGRLPIPPSYSISQLTNIKYTVGVNIVFESITGIDDELDMNFQCLPLCKALPRVPTPFLYIPAREDWSFSREIIGGWTLTPFGDRDRLCEEMVEVEGIMLRFSLLWSTNPLALEALGQPAAIDVGFYKSDVFAHSVLQPRTSSRKNRYLGKLATGRMWRMYDGRPADDAPMSEIQMVTLPDPPPPGNVSPPTLEQCRVKGMPSKRMQEVWAEGQEQDEKEKREELNQKREERAESIGSASGDAKDATLNNDPPSLDNVDAGLAALQVDAEVTLSIADTDDDATERAPSPTPSLEDITTDDHPAETDHFVRLDGEVRVPACTHPNFRFSNMGREYVMHLLIRHPQYDHVSPNATGFLAEFPVWYVLDRFAKLPAGAAEAVKPQTAEDLAALPMNGTAVPVGRTPSGYRWLSGCTRRSGASPPSSRATSRSSLHHTILMYTTCTIRVICTVLVVIFFSIYQRVPLNFQAVPLAPI